MNKLLFTSLFSFTILLSLAQDSLISPFQDNFFRISIDLKSYQFLDQQTSALAYKGNIAGIQLAYESNNNTHQYGIGLTANYGSVIGKTEYASYLANQGIFGLDGFYTHRFFYDKKIKTFFGLSIHHDACLHYNQNLQNASMNLSVLNNIGLNAIFDKDFSWKSKNYKLWFLKFKRRDRHIKTSFKAELPVYFQNYRSPYASISDFSDGENLWSLEPSSYINFSKAFMLSTNTSLTYYLHNGNAIRLSYQWQIFRFKDNFYTYQAAYHAFTFSLLMKLN
jgi:hypothetical protein